MATIIYCHGFASVGNSPKVEQLRESFSDHSVLSPDLPPNPRQALEILEPLVFEAESHPVILVGTSLGGFFALYMSQVFDVPCVLVNPCTRPSEVLAQYLGKEVKNFKTGEPITISQDDIQVFKTLESGLDDVRNGTLIQVLVAADDDVIDWNTTACDIPFASRFETFRDGGHRFEKHWGSVIKAVRRLI